MSEQNNGKQSTVTGELLVQLLAKAMIGCDVNTLEGRAHFVANAKEIWRDMESVKQKSELVCLVSELALLRECDLLELWLGWQPVSRN